MIFYAILFVVIMGVTSQNETEAKIRNLKFPQNFLFGAGTSAVQVEGAWNEDGKGESGWDRYVHDNPWVVTDNSTSDVACNSYHLFREDIPYVTRVGMNTYLFSLSWSRLLPTGDPNNVNQIAVDYYNNLINETLSYNITPVVTMYHWDLPLNLTRIGGWANSNVIDHFVDYAAFVLKTFGDKVKYWITMNNPNIECSAGYGGSTLAPGTNLSGIADYQCGHNMMVAHAKVYRLYKSMPSKIRDGGKMGVGLQYVTYYPRNDTSSRDNAAADIATEFMFGWFADPIFGTGDYPAIMRAQVNFRSRKEGLRESRLPTFTPEERILLKDSADFLGLNQYTGLFASFSKCPNYRNGCMNPDIDIWCCPSPNLNYTHGNFMQVVPGSLKDSLSHIREKYSNPLVYVTENGYPDDATENITYNPARESYFQGSLTDVYESIEEGSNLQGYITWGLLDDFEWSSGYTPKFGIVHVDFKNINKTRTLKAIGNFFKNCALHGLNVTESNSTKLSELSTN